MPAPPAAERGRAWNTAAPAMIGMHPTARCLRRGGCRGAHPQRRQRRRQRQHGAPVITGTWLTVACGTIVATAAFAHFSANSVAICSSQRALRSGAPAAESAPGRRGAGQVLKLHGTGRKRPRQVLGYNVSAAGKQHKLRPAMHAPGPGGGGEGSGGAARPRQGAGGDRPPQACRRSNARTCERTARPPPPVLLN